MVILDANHRVPRSCPAGIGAPGSVALASTVAHQQVQVYPLHAMFRAHTPARAFKYAATGAKSRARLNVPRVTNRVRRSVSTTDVPRHVASHVRHAAKHATTCARIGAVHGHVRRSAMSTAVTDLVRSVFRVAIAAPPTAVTTASAGSAMFPRSARTKRWTSSAPTPVACRTSPSCD